MLGDTIRILGITGDVMTAPLEEGDAGTQATLKVMAELVNHAQRSPWVLRAVTDIRARFAKGEYGAGADNLGVAVFYWLKNRVRFCRDPRSVELIRQPDIMLRDIFGKGGTCVDCDEMATLGATLLRALKFRTVFTVISQRADGRFQHVYFGFYAANGSIAQLDPQETRAPGLEVNNTRKLVWPVP